MASQKHIGELGGDGVKVSPKVWPSAGRICYYRCQVTDNYIYAIYDGPNLKIMNESGILVFTHEGNVVKTLVLDRPIAGIYVDEVPLFGTINFIWWNKPAVFSKRRMEIY